MLGGSADRLCTPSTSAGPFRIFAVAGFQNRANDIVYCPPIIRQTTQNVEDSTAIVYFGGDVQDFPESMETNRDSRGYMKYNLENSAILLREAFPRSHIIVIRPVRMEFKTFSCFDNFVRGNNAGVPDHTPMNHALQHLEKLLQNLSHRLVAIPENEILDQAAQAAATAAAVAAAAAAAALTLSNANAAIEAANAAAAAAAANSAAGGNNAATNATHTKANTTPATKTTTANTTTNNTSSSSTSSSSSKSSSSNDCSQEMDIDILQVQENVTLSTDGAVIFPSADIPSENLNDTLNTSHDTDMDTSPATDGESVANTNDIPIAAMTNNNCSSLPPVDAEQSQTSDATSTADNNTNATATSTTSTPTPSTTTAHLNNLNNDCAMDQQQQDDQHQQQPQQPENSNPLWWRENLNLDKSKLILIGFSKGCVVLNQFIYEFHYLKTLTPDDSTMVRLLSRIKDMYWLDGGHGGQKNTWITSRSLLETLTRMAINVHVHLTPYQVQDDRRPWIRKEEKIFSDMLRRLGAAITRHLHYDSQTPNLMTHFEVLQAFCEHIHNLQQTQNNEPNKQQQLQTNELSNNKTANNTILTGAGATTNENSTNETEK